MNFPSRSVITEEEKSKFTSTLLRIAIRLDHLIMADDRFVGIAIRCILMELEKFGGEVVKGVRMERSLLRAVANFQLS